MNTSMNELQNVLATRYASQEMKDIWSSEEKVISERRLWVAILKAQKDLGLDISDETISAYEGSIENVDLDSIANREKVLQHDVKARIEEFSDLAGKDQIHLGLTSRDITENIEQEAILKSAKLIFKRAVGCLAKLNNKAEQYKSTPTIARTHNMAAQVTTLGRKYAMLGEEFLLAIEKLEKFISEYRFRGLKGAVGTQSDLLELFGGDGKKVQKLEDKINEYLSISEKLSWTGQIYPRSLDLDFSQHLVQLLAGPNNFAINLRLMAASGSSNERGTTTEVGSSAMPHKVNPSLCERISGLAVLVKGYSSMLGNLSGNQWHEGDVSCSVVRRVALPDICFATEGLLISYEKILDEMWVDEKALAQEVEEELPFLSSSKLLMAATQKGMGREVAHKMIGAESKLAQEDLADIKGFVALDEHPLVNRLAESKDFKLDKATILKTIQAKPLFGMAESQTDAYLKYSLKYSQKHSLKYS